MTNTATKEYLKVNGKYQYTLELVTDAGFKFIAKGTSAKKLQDWLYAEYSICGENFLASIKRSYNEYINKCNATRGIWFDIHDMDGRYSYRIVKTIIETEIVEVSKYDKINSLEDITPELEKLYLELVAKGCNEKGIRLMAKISIKAQRQLATKLNIG